MLQVRSRRSRIPLPRRRSGRPRGWRLGPADLVTLARAVLTALVAMLIGLVMAGQTAGGTRAWCVGLIVGSSAVALVLDNVDGRVARRTGTASEFGARFDQEVDAALILVLSGYVAWDLAASWVLAIGLLHYALALGRRVLGRRALPWLRGQAPPRYWCKVVAAVQGVVLTVAAAGVLPDDVSRLALAVALVLLVESFGREVWQLWRAGHEPARPRSGVLTGVGAVVLVWTALSLPDRTAELSLPGLARVPLELLAVLALGLLVPRRAARTRRAAALVLGVVLAVGVLLKGLDLGFGKALGRPFDPLADWGSLRSAVELVRDAVGGPVALVAVAGLGLAVLAVLVLVPVATARSVDLAAVHRRAAAACVVLVAVGLSMIGSAGTVRAAAGEVSRVREGLRDRPVFAAELAADRYAGVPGDRLLNGLRGKHVLLVFVESYGRVALEDPQFAPGVTATLDRGTQRLRDAGFEARSGWLTSPTFGGSSWLAHSTLQSGLWVNGQRRYDQLIRADRLTLTRAFAKAGWRTVVQVPANVRPWPEGRRFYGADQVYGASDLGYAGPPFGYATMPDQFTLAALHRLELSARPGGHPGTSGGSEPAARVMAEVDLVSSHYPWAPLPRAVAWSRVGDGSVFRGMPEQGPAGDAVIGDAAALRRGYAASITYSLDSVISFVTEHPDPDLVLVVLGDHQPIGEVSGPRAHREVPVSIVAHDPAVLGRVDPWGWQPGLRPPSSPVPEQTAWRMDTFRDRFLDAFTDR